MTHRCSAPKGHLHHPLRGIANTEGEGCKELQGLEGGGVRAGRLTVF